MNIYKREIKQKLVSAAIWSLSIAGIIILFMSVFSAFSESSDMVNLIEQNYPEELLKAFGMSGVDLSSLEGYFTMCMLFVQITLAVQASIYGFSILSEEERDMTADFLLTRPVTRTKIFVSKTFAALTAVLITYAATWGSTFFAIEIFRNGKQYDADIIIKMMWAVILFQLFFLSVGMVLSVMSKKIKDPLPVAMSLAFGMYLISTVGSIIGEETLGYLTPFKYFEPNTLILEGKYDPIYIAICCGVIILSLSAGYMLYIKRNIHSAS